MWRTPHSVQVGIDPPKAVLEGITVTQERMLAALVLGISATGVTLLREDSPGDRDGLLATLAPALLTEPPPACASVVGVSGDGMLVDYLTGFLSRSGVHVLRATEDSSLRDTEPTIAVVVGRWVLAPGIQSHWLRRDVPHLPIVFSDTGVSVGPLVEPGDGPCLRCIELHRTDADPAWPAIATQLGGLGGGAESPVLAADAAVEAFRMIAAHLEGTRGEPSSVRIDAATGARESRLWRVHPACGCQGIDELFD